MTIVWLAASIPVLIWFRESVPILVFISIYANVIGHWSSWQAVRVEEKQDTADEKAGAPGP